MQTREYWMIYRGPGFLAVVWFGSSTIPFPSPPPLPTGEGRRGVGGGAKSNGREKAWPSIHHWILSGTDIYIFVQWSERKRWGKRGGRREGKIGSRTSEITKIFLSSMGLLPPPRSPPPPSLASVCHCTVKNFNEWSSPQPKKSGMSLLKLSLARNTSWISGFLEFPLLIRKTPSSGRSIPSQE